MLRWVTRATGHGCWSNGSIYCHRGRLWRDLRSSQVLGWGNWVLPHTTAECGFLDLVTFVGGTVLCGWSTCKALLVQRVLHLRIRVEGANSPPAECFFCARQQNAIPSLFSKRNAANLPLQPGGRVRLAKPVRADSNCPPTLSHSTIFIQQSTPCSLRGPGVNSHAAAEWAAGLPISTL